MIRLIEYLDAHGRNPFVRWREKLDDTARARVTKSLVRLENGNTSNLKGIGGGLVELKIDFGPGYRIYLAWDGPRAVILFGGGTKSRQQADIEIARERWTDYRRQAKQGKQVMPLTHDFRETVMEDMRKNPGFRDAMLREAVDSLLEGELNVGKSILRDYVNATIGFEGLAKKVKIPVKSLMRMLGPTGNPQMSNIFAIIGALQAHAGIALHTAAE